MGAQSDMRMSFVTGATDFGGMLPTVKCLRRGDTKRRSTALRCWNWAKLQRDGDLALIEAVAIRFTTVCFFVASLGLLGMWTRSYSTDHHVSQHTRAMFGTTF